MNIQERKRFILRELSSEFLITIKNKSIQFRDYQVVTTNG